MYGNVPRPDAEPGAERPRASWVRKARRSKARPIIFEDFAQRTAIRFNRRIARPLLGRFLAEPSYDSIRESFRPDDVTIADLSLDASKLTTKDLDRAAAILDWHGVVALHGLIDLALIDTARQEADLLVERIERAIASPKDHGEVGDILWQVGGARFSSHQAILAQGRPLANLRSRRRGTLNGGLIDFFFVDQAARDSGWNALDARCGILKGPPLVQVIAAVSSAKPQQVNMLRNDSVTATRSLHIDNLDGSYKAFLYLSDAYRPEDGPYAYVPGSHRRLDLLKREARLNSLKGRPETNSYAFEGREISFPVERGTVIISCQSGVHRGMPQQEGASRTVLVGNYRN